MFAFLIPILRFGSIVAVLFERQHRASRECSLRDTARALTVAVDHELISSLSTLQALVTSGTMLISSSASFSGCTARRSMRA